MAYSRGGSAVRRFLIGLPDALERKVLPGAARAAGEVVAEEARLNVRSQLVAEHIKVKTERGAGYVRATISIIGSDARADWARSLGVWLEYGTDPHYITVDDSQSDGKSAARINRLADKGVLVINGRPVGKTVLHPGAQSHPFLRPALDLRARAAAAAGQSYIKSRVSRNGIAASDEDSE